MTTTDLNNHTLSRSLQKAREIIVSGGKLNRKELLLLLNEADSEWRNTCNEQEQTIAELQNQLLEVRLNNLELREQISLRNANDFQPIYGPTDKPIEAYFKEEKKAIFARHILEELRRKWPQKKKGFYAELANIIGVWDRLGWLKALNSYQDDTVFWRTIDNLIQHDTPINYDSARRALNRWRQQLTQDINNQKISMCQKYEDFCAVA